MSGLPLVGEVPLVQVSLIHRPHVSQEKECQAHDDHIRFDLLHLKKEDHTRCEPGEDRRAQGIHPEQASAVGPERISQGGLVIAVLGRYEIACQVRKEGKKQGDAPHNPRGPFQCGKQFLFIDVAEEHLVHGDHGQDGHGQCRDHQGHAHGPEFVVSGHVVHEEIGEEHEIFTPCKHDAQNRGSQQPPFDPSVSNKHSQHK